MNSRKRVSNGSRPGGDAASILWCELHICYRVKRERESEIYTYTRVREVTEHALHGPTIMLF